MAPLIVIGIVIAAYLFLSYIIISAYCLAEWMWYTRATEAKKVLLTLIVPLLPLFGWYFIYRSIQYNK